MADYKHREDSWSLFRNDHKEPGSNQPDYRGTGNLGGQPVKLAAWLKETQDGKKFFSGKFEVEKTLIEEVNEKIDKGYGEVIEDDIPFFREDRA